MVPARAQTPAPRVDTRSLRRAGWSGCDDDVLAARRAEQARTERTDLNRALNAARREWASAPVATSWMSMTDEERAEIRPARRRTAAGLLVLVRGEGRPDARVCGGGGEAA